MRTADDQPSIEAFRARMVFAIAASIVPATLIGVLLVGYDYFKREQTRLERDAMATTRALVAAVDRELTGARAALLALATSPHLDAGELAAFHAQARLAMRDQPFLNVVLMGANGQQLLNTSRSFGDPLPTTADPLGLSRVFETGEPLISGLFTGQVTRLPIIGVTVPVVRAGKIRYALGAAISPERLSDLLHDQRLPSSWRVGVVDANGTVVARSHDAQRFVGKPAAIDLLRKMKETPEAAFPSQTLEGMESLSVFSRSAMSGWTVAIAIPEHELRLQLVTSLARLFVVAFIVLAAALGSAVLIARRLFAKRR